MMLPVLLTAAEVDDGCAEILRYSSRDYSVEKSDIGVAMKVYEQYCENETVKKGTTFNAGLDAVIKAVPIKFSLGAGSSAERTKHFCKTFDSAYKRDEAYYKETSTAVAHSTTAWLACKGLASQGLVFRPQLSKTLILIDIVRTKALPVSVQGITYDQKLATCTVPNTSTSNTPILADKNTVKSLEPGSWTVTCVRKPETISNEQIFQAIDISIATTDGPFLLPVAADAKFSYQWASEFQQQLTAIATDLKRVDMQSGTIPMVAEGTRALNDGSQCPVGTETLRGKAGRFEFPKPFESSPTVTAALSLIDVTGDVNRLSMEILSADKNGFNYKFFTSCKTIVYNATASWLAVAK